jgi:hypothetical protein
MRSCLSSVLPAALAVWVCLASTVRPASAAFPRESTKQPQSPVDAACFGILGEVARPGVYELPADCTLGELLRQAGGATPDADGNVRVFRAARLAQQLFVASSAAAKLYPGDLIVIERGTVAAQPSEVQLGFLNLIDRPVVIKLSREQASLVQIVERLRQPTELVDSIQIYRPSRKSFRPLTSSNEAESLRSGTVLVFPAQSVRVASLPPLPEPIVVARAQPTVDPSPPGNAPDPQSAAKRPPQRVGLPRAVFRQSARASQAEPTLRARGGSLPREQTERLIGAASARVASEISGSPFRNVAPEVWERQQRQGAEGSRARSNIFFFALAGTAALAMFLTIGSMGRRGIALARLRNSRSTAILPPVPTLPDAGGMTRPIRVDANQPQTRLSIDLVVFEQARARHAHATTAPGDPTPKAA